MKGFFAALGFIALSAGAHYAAIWSNDFNPGWEQRLLFSTFGVGLGWIYCRFYTALAA